jgi:hypothetical protein
VHAGVSVMPQTLDLVLQLQFTTLEFHDFQVIDRGMDQAIVDFAFERLMPFFEFRKVRLHRHSGCLLNQYPLMELSLTQTQHKGDVTPGFAPQQIVPKPLIGGDFSARLNAAVENAIIIGLGPTELGPKRIPGRRKPAVAMNDEDERALREQLSRLQQEHRDLDAAIAALALSPGSDLIQVQRLKKRKLVLRDKIRRIDDQLTPDIIA